MSDLPRQPEWPDHPRTAPTTLRLLGGFALTRRDFQGDGLAYEKARALLAYVAVESGVVHPRRRLAALLWPDLPTPTALGNLRLVLLNLRVALAQACAPAPRLLITRDTVQLDPTSAASVDVLRHADAPSACSQPSMSPSCVPCLQRLQAADAEERGTLLDGLSLPDCPEFEDWLQVRREAQQRSAHARLTLLADCHAKLGNTGLALEFALRHLRLAPWEEAVHRRVMHLYAAHDQASNALAQYASCCTMLRDTYGCAPHALTTALAERIRQGCGTAPRLAPASERRQVTILYCELSAEGLDDPDAIIDLLTPVRRRGVALLRRFSGHVVQTYTGGILAYFGYPLASETAPRRALQAAQALVQERVPNTRMRVAVHTERIVCGELPDAPDPVGAATALTVRLRRCVENGAVAASSATMELVAGYFDGIDLGLQTLPGSAQPLRVHQVMSVTGANNRLTAAAALAPLVGRARALATLRRAWRSALPGRATVVLVRGEAGIGKSRLMLALRALRTQSCLLQCQQELVQSAWHPFVTLFDDLLGANASSDPETRFARLAARIEALDKALAPCALPLFASMLGLTVAAPYRQPLTLPPQRRTDSLEALIRLALCLATGGVRSPGLLVVEDLQWADPSTLEWLTRLLAEPLAQPLMVVLTARPDAALPLPFQSLSILDLPRLQDAHVHVLISYLAPQLSVQTRVQLVQRADGNPLFAEELTRSLTRTPQGQGPGSGSTTIPVGLEALLMAQIDQLGSAKATARLAACLGHSFTFDVMSRISPLAPTLLAEALRQLVESGILNGDDDGRYQFRHALIRDAAYQSLARTERRQAHLRIAHMLIQTNADSDGEAVPEVVASHLESGDAIAEAAQAWLRAGQRAARLAAHREAILHLRRGLRLIARLPEGALRVQGAFDLQYALGLSAIALDGYAAPEAIAAHQCAQALCEQMPANPNMFLALWGMWTSASSRAGYRHARELAQKLNRMALASGHPLHQQQARFARGNTAFWQGKFAPACQDMDYVLAQCSWEDGASHVALFGENLRITAGAYRSWITWFMGDIEAARVASTNNLAEARRCGHPFSLAYALVFAAHLHCRLGRAREALALAEEIMALAGRHDFDLWRIGAILAHGWARALQGSAEGVAAMEQCIDSLRVAMGGVSLVLLGPLASTQALLGEHASALCTSQQALSLGEQLGDYHIHPELLCLCAESARQLGTHDPAQVRHWLETALTLSRRQGAKGFEARARAALAALTIL